jgi:general stress protein 26
VHETDADLEALDAILERSFDAAGPHLTGIISETRRLSARDLCAYLVGTKHFVVATTTARGEPRCSAVDTLFLHGHVWFSTSGTSAKARQLERRAAVSAAHVIGDDVGVFVHGTARIVRGATEAAATLAPFWRDVYEATPEDWVDAPHDARYIEIVPASMYTYAFNRERFEALVERGPTAAS